jgi:hypothetical protein
MAEKQEALGTQDVGLPPGQSVHKCLTLWILQHDYRLLFNAYDKKPARYGVLQRRLCDESMALRIDVTRAVDYYNTWQAELVHDTAMCHDICPLFVLHACAKMLRNDADRCHASLDVMLLMHVIKERIVLTGKEMGPFVRRLLGLAELYANINSGRKRAMLRYPHYLTVATVFMTTNLRFMVWDDGGQDTPHYVFAVDDIKKQCAIRDIVETCLVAPMVDPLGEQMTLRARLARYRALSSVFTRAFMTFQMDAHCGKLERAWLPYYSTNSRHPSIVIDTPSMMTPACLTMQLFPPPLHGIEDGDQLVQALKACRNTASYVSWHAVDSTVDDDDDHDDSQPFNLYQYVSRATELQMRMGAGNDNK